MPREPVCEMALRMRPLPMALAAVFLTAGLFGQVAADQAPLADPLAALRPGHPRLLMTDAELAAAKLAARTDPLRAALHERIIASAEIELSAPPLVYKIVGPRLLAQSMAAIDHIATCGMAYRLTGDPRFAERARRDMLTASAFVDWHPSHFLDVAEMALAVGIGYDWLYSYLAPGDRSTIRKALVDKALVFAPAAYGPNSQEDKRLFWARSTMNWNQVCNGGLLTAALAVAEDEPELARTVIGGVRATLPGSMAAYQPDGAYPEGPAYWAYGTTFNVVILAELEGCLGTDFGLGKAPAFDRTALYRLAVQGPTGLGFNYADGDAAINDSDDRGLAPYAWLAQRYHWTSALWHSRELIAQEAARRGENGDRFLAMDAVWYPAAPDDSAKSEPLDMHFRGRADIALFRSSWGDRRALFVGFKAGDNATNHAHLDLGSFVLDADGVRWAESLGSDNYNLPEYFGAKRWTYFRLNNHSQNTLTPGDRLQEATAVAPIVAFGSSPARAFAVADLTAAYPGEAKRILRGLAVVDRSRVLIEDELLEARPGTPLRWAMVTSAAISLAEDGRSALLTQGGRSLRVEALAPADARFRVGSTKPPTPAENPNAGTALLVLDIPAPVAASDVLIATLLSPVGDRWPALSPPPLDRPSAWR